MWKSINASPSLSGFFPLRQANGDHPPIMGHYSEVENKWSMSVSGTQYYSWLVESGKYDEWYDWK